MIIVSLIRIFSEEKEEEEEEGEEEEEKEEEGLNKKVFSLLFYSNQIEGQ
jgi:hypothetical protein